MWVSGRQVLSGWIGPGGLWTLHRDGTSWVKQKIEGCPLGSPRSLAVDRTGALCVDSLTWAGNPSAGLARFDGRSWETIHEVGGSPISDPTVLGIAPDGAVWIAAGFTTTPGAAASSQGESLMVRAARLDGKNWTVVDLPSDYVGDLVLAPDGTLWTSTGRGPAHYDGERWTFPYAGVIPTAVPWEVPVLRRGSRWHGVQPDADRHRPLPRPGVATLTIRDEGPEEETMVDGRLLTQRVLVGIAVMALLAGCSASATPTPTPAPTPARTPPPAVLSSPMPVTVATVRYTPAVPCATYSGVVTPCQLELFIFAPTSGGPWPLVVAVPGGPVSNVSDLVGFDVFGRAFAG